MVFVCFDRIVGVIIIACYALDHFAIKLNQIGLVSETLEIIKMSHSRLFLFWNKA